MKNSNINVQILLRGKNYLIFTFEEQSVQNGNGKKVEDQQPAAWSESTQE